MTVPYADTLWMAFNLEYNVQHSSCSPQFSWPLLLQCVSVSLAGQ